MKAVNKHIVNKLIDKIRIDTEKNPYLDIDLADVLYSYLNTTEDTFHILCDWNEYIEGEKMQIDYIKECIDYINKFRFLNEKYNYEP
jgi:hypothetical protein